MTDHLPACNCFVCQQIAQGKTVAQAKHAMVLWEAEQMCKHRWFMHAVRELPDFPFGVNFHTHGAAGNLRHPDLQIVLNMDANLAHAIFTTVLDRVKQGERFSAGQVDDDLIRNPNDEPIPVLFVEALEEGRKVLRLILPDRKGRVRREEIRGMYRKQFWDLG